MTHQRLLRLSIKNEAKTASKHAILPIKSMILPSKHAIFGMRKAIFNTSHTLGRGVWPSMRRHKNMRVLCNKSNNRDRQDEQLYEKQASNPDEMSKK